MATKLFEQQVRSNQQSSVTNNFSCIGNRSMYGVTGWVLDHIISIDEAERYGWTPIQVNHPANLRVIPAIVNLHKGSKSDLDLYKRRQDAYNSGNHYLLPYLY